MSVLMFHECSPSTFGVKKRFWHALQSLPLLVLGHGILPDAADQTGRAQGLSAKLKIAVDALVASYPKWLLHKLSQSGAVNLIQHLNTGNPAWHF